MSAKYTCIGIVIRKEGDHRFADSLQPLETKTGKRGEEEEHKDTDDLFGSRQSQLNLRPLFVPFPIVCACVRVRAERERDLVVPSQKVEPEQQHPCP